MSDFRCPFAKENELNDELGTERVTLQLLRDLALPGLPNMMLAPTTKLIEHLHRELCSDDLDKLAPKLWMMSLQSSSNISPLHRQKVKGRSIVVAEDPKLHLVWHTDVIFIKPLPPYLMSWTFWQMILAPTSYTPLLDTRTMQVRRWALGFLRSYGYLIQHKSDFIVAQRHDLVPEGTDWESFCRFAGNLLAVSDDSVSQRYTYGELRLTRLNFYSRLFLRKPHFHRIHRRYSTYFAQFYGPILFILGLLSVLLSAMQANGASQLLVEKHPASVLWKLCKWFSATAFVSVAFVGWCLLMVFMFKFVREWWHAIRHRPDKLGGGVGSRLKNKDIILGESSV
jgi:hypothetical protein